MRGIASFRGRSGRWGERVGRGIAHRSAPRRVRFLGLVVALHAVMKAGSAYVPLDPASPTTPTRFYRARLVE